MQAQGRRTLPEANASTPTATVGASYRFLVRSAEEAVGTIRKQLGDDARVVSVRAVKAGGVAGLLGGTRLEVIAQVPAPEPLAVEATAKSATVEPVSPVMQTAPAGVRRNATPVATYAAATAAADPFGKLEAAAPVSDFAAANRVAPGARLETLLRRSGLSESLIARLESTAGWPAESDRPLHQGLSAVAGQIRQLSADIVSRPLPARAAFIGLPGMGCTTALCKWLSAEVFTHGRHGTVASVEFERPKGSEDLAVFSELLGVEFTRQVPAPATADTDGSRFCYLDVPAISLTRPDENARLRAFLDENRIPGRVLVVSGLMDSAVLRQACSAGMDVGCTHLVFTQLDELPQWGKLWDFLIEAPLAPLMATLGPSLSGECETDVVGAVLRRTFPWS